MADITAPPLPAGTPNNSTPASMIRNISQTVQEREIVKTCPDIVCYLDGLPYLLNYFINNPTTGASYTLVNFNDHVTQFNASYDTDIMIPNATIGLQVPNFLKHLYQSPGGNNLIQTMMEVQVFAKGYFLANNGDTVYRRVFKGLVSHIGYNDNGKTLEISVQCYGTLHFLELMQVNVSPSLQSSPSIGVSATIFNTIMGGKNPYDILVAMLTNGLVSPGFQQTNLGQTNPVANNNVYSQAVRTGYISKWQAILASVSKEVHLYGYDKDHPTTAGTAQSDVYGSKAKNEVPASPTRLPTTSEDSQSSNLYYKQIRQYQPEMTITDVSLLNNKIISRMEYVRQMIQVINFEGYQDIDGKIIIKPPLYNLDVTNLGQRNQSTTPSTTTGSSAANSSTSNPLTEIYPQTNPFIIYLSEILTENESEDQAAIRKTRTVVQGNINPALNVGYPKELLATAEYIDIPKLQKYGLREEPTIQVPWIKGSSFSLFAHAVAETVRANRGYRTYTVTIPIRPELKLGFPMYIPHKDMYGYIKSVNISYNVGATANMTVTMDAIRRRVLIPTVIKKADGTQYTSYNSAPNLIYKWTRNSLVNTNQPTPGQSGNSLQNFASMSTTAAQGTNTAQSNNAINPAMCIDKPASIPLTTAMQNSVSDNYLQSVRSTRMGNSWTMQPDTTAANYVVQNDTTNTITDPLSGLSHVGIFSSERPVDNDYFISLQSQSLVYSAIPFTDGKGYEVVGPFPWGRFKNLRSTIKEFTQDGYIVPPTDVNGNPSTSQQDISVLNTTDAFLFAGLGTPTATQHPSDQLISALAQLQNQADTDTVIVLDYSSGQNSNDQQLLNTAQPDINNQTNASTQNTQSAQQQVIDVLVSGNAAPMQGAQQTIQQVTTPVPTTSVAV